VKSRDREGGLFDTLTRKIIEKRLLQALDRDTQAN